MRQKLYKLKKLMNKVWAVDTTNLKFAQRLDECVSLKAGAVYYDDNKITHRQFIFAFIPKTGTLWEAKKRLDSIFSTERVDIKKYE